MKCVVCNKELEPSEYDLDKCAEEFNKYPAHSDCFDSFHDAEEFIEYAKNVYPSRESK